MRNPLAPVADGIADQEMEDLAEDAGVGLDDDLGHGDLDIGAEILVLDGDDESLRFHIAPFDVRDELMGHAGEELPGGPVGDALQPQLELDLVLAGVETSPSRTPEEDHDQGGNGEADRDLCGHSGPESARRIDAERTQPEQRNHQEHRRPTAGNHPATPS